MLGSTGFLVFILISLALAVTYAIAIFCAGAVIFSRVSFSLAAAFILSQGRMTLVASSGFLNYVAWALVVMGVVYFISTLPRVDMALKFLCTILLSVVMVYLALQLFGNIIAAIVKTKFVFSAPFEILVKVICILFAVFYMLVEKKPHYDCPENPILYNLERALASLMYGLAIAFLCFSIEGNWNIPAAVGIFVLVAGTVAAFIADVYLAGKDVLGLDYSSETVVPK